MTRMKGTKHVLATVAVGQGCGSGRGTPNLPILSLLSQLTGSQANPYPILSASPGLSTHPHAIGRT